MPLKLSDLKPEDIQVPGQDQPSSSGLKLSDLSVDDVKPIDHEEQESIQKPNDFTKTQSFGQGALQGATAGFSDELGGVEGALQEKLLNALPGAKTDDKKSIKDLYKEYRDLHRDRNKQAEEAHPIANLAGNVTGAIGGAVLAPEMLAAKSVAGGAGLGAAAGLGTSNSDLTDPNAQNLKQAAKDTAVGTGLGAVAGVAGKGINKLLNPESLDVAGSKMAQEAMGMNSAKDLTTQYNPMSGKVERGSDIIKGTGNTAMDQGVLKGGTSKWYDNALEALNTNYDRLPPLLSSVQKKIDSNVPGILDKVGGIATKTPNAMQDIFDSIPQNSQRNLIVKKIGQQYSIYEQKLAQADGNLQALNDIKKELTTAAQNLSPQIYNSGTAKTEAELYKRLGGVVRQHIEDLASAADPGAGDQIHTINQNIGNITSMMPALQKTTRGGIPTNVKDIAQKVVGPIEAIGAKAINQTAKAIKTPVGSLVQKSVAQAPKGVLTNPFSQERLESSKSRNDDSTASNTSTSLYNATDDSLKNVATKFKQTPGLEYYADQLNNAIDTSDNGAKNRAVFLIMQNPRARKLVTEN